MIRLAIITLVTQLASSGCAMMTPMDCLLFRSGSDGDVEQVKLALESGANINIQDKHWNNITVLHKASKLGRVEVAKCLLNYGADVNSNDVYHQTPLYVAAKKGHTAIVKLLLAYGANINAQTLWGETPLQIAAYNGELERNKGYISIVKLLLEAGADPTIKNNYEETALDRAQKGYLQEIVSLLKATIPSLKHMTAAKLRNMIKSGALSLHNIKGKIPQELYELIHHGL